MIQYDCCATEKWNVEKIFTIIQNKFKSIIKFGWVDIKKFVFTFHISIDCRKHIKFNQKSWWIMHLHHIGLPPATNGNLIVLVSGNYLNLNSRR